VAPARFVTDTSLDLLARRLRILGFDVVTLPDTRLDQLFERARSDQRIVLTLSARHPRRYAGVPAITVARDPLLAVRAIAEEFEPAGGPFSRCALCNHPLEPRRPGDAGGAVPGHVLELAKALHHCPGCGKWYWPGSHVDRLRVWLERSLGRPVPGPEIGVGGDAD
jgi:hypothetical protein